MIYGTVYENGNKEYEKTSRYQVLRVIAEGRRYLETYNNVQIPESSDDVYHIVRNREVGRLDIISSEYYGDPSLWWAIALANKFIDPFIVNEGDLIRIPSVIELSDPRNEILSIRGGSYR